MPYTIPTLDAYTAPDAAALFDRLNAERALRREQDLANALQRREERRLSARAKGAQARSNPLPSVVGYMRTIQADRRDYTLMLGYMRARIREDLKESMQAPSSL